jgi:hypothetical protein
MIYNVLEKHMTKSNITYIWTFRYRLTLLKVTDDLSFGTGTIGAGGLTPRMTMLEQKGQVTSIG